ncbi:hypothetical protein DDE19_12305 [Micromonospora ureilytica]|uniref:DUF4240 domain-containing protein n=2 Tax=Micromonospora ureilytica TaxID=709868 RepID=A0A3N9XWE6_9ACTN|nr:hypothetical protein DDE19_12305 [Micromonospora ureilytica]
MTEPRPTPASPHNASQWLLATDARVDRHEWCRLAVGDSRAVDVDEFWAVVESAGAGLDGRYGDDGEAVAAALVTRLAATSPEGILEFQELFDQLHGALYRWDVWAAAYLIGGGCSDDSFIDFRAGVIALGREWYERVLASPDALADQPAVRQAAAEDDDGALFAESVNYVASEAYEQVTGGDDDAFYEAMKTRQHAAVGIDEAHEPDMGENFDFDNDDEMRRRLPRLAELFLRPAED